MTVKISNWMFLIMAILLGLLFFSLIRGCNNLKHAATNNVNLNERIRQQKEDSISSANSLKEYKDSLEIVNGLLSLRENKLDKTETDLAKANDRIDALLNKYEPVSINNDTNVTLVPNEYIEDCAGCFSELSNGQKLVKLYKGQVDSVKLSYQAKDRIQNNRIAQLSKENASINSKYKSLLDSTVAPTKQTRKLFLSISTMAINQNLPNAIGGGFFYQDKKYRIFGAKIYGSPYGLIKTVDVALPLSLRIIK